MASRGYSELDLCCCFWYAHSLLAYATSETLATSTPLCKYALSPHFFSFNFWIIYEDVNQSKSTSQSEAHRGTNI